MTGYLVIGKSLPRVDGVPKVTGAAVYSEDLVQPGMLWGKCARSTRAHARVLRVDTTAARQVPGVVAVLTAADVPPTLVGQTLRDQPPLAPGVVRFVGEKVVAIAAETPEAADEAAALVEIEYEELPAVFDPLAAIAAGAPILHPDLRRYPGFSPSTPDLPNVHVHQRITKGDPAEGFAQAAHVFEHTFRTPKFHQVYLEPHACVVSVDPDGTAHVHTANKMPFMTRKRFAAALNLPEEQAVFYNAPIGGDFGGKGSLIDEPVAYFLAKATGRPVKMLMTSVEEFQAANPRHAAVFKLKTGVTAAGLICARSIEIYWDSGAYGGHRPLPDATLPGDKRALGPYRIPHAQIDAYYVYTNHVPGGHMRAPGSPQVVFAAESQIDLIAAALGIDPLEFRLRNGLEEGDRSPIGEPYHGVRMKETLQAAVAAYERGQAPASPGLLRGVGIACCERNTGGGRSTAKVRVEPDGTVNVITGACDPGNNTFTMLKQVAGEAFQVDPRSVRLTVLNSDTAPWDQGVGASRVTHVVGSAALRAAAGLRERLKGVAADLLEAPAEVVELTPRGFVASEQPGRAVSLQAAAQELHHREGDALEYAEYSSGEPHEHTFATHLAEVDVDPETGRVFVRRLICAHDTGTVINPLSATAQIEGGAIQGLGFALMEELRSEDGRIVNGNLSDYKAPSLLDVPPKLEIVLIEDGPSPHTTFGAKAIAEVTSMPVPAAVANAVANATGVRLMSLPVTAEKVLAGMRERARQAEVAATVD